MKKFETEVHLSREMSLMDATLIGVGAMIGAGIFVLTGIAAGVAGPALIITFSLNGVVALLTAFSYAWCIIIGYRKGDRDRPEYPVSHCELSTDPFPILPAHKAI